ncbi:MAG: M1 family metallopeptidase [bacterium]|nr:M1 family metallopeptidase [bacterium]
MGVAIARPVPLSTDGPASDSDLTSYTIVATLDPDGGRISGTAVITVPKGMSSLAGKVNLDLHSAGTRENGDAKLIVEGIWSANGEKLRSETLEEEGVVQVFLPKALSDAQPVNSFEVRYSVILEESDMESYGYHIFTGVSSGNYWYPDITGSDGSRSRFFDFDIDVTYPSDWTIMTSGGLAEPADMPADASDGQIREEYRARHVEGCALALGEGFVLQTLEAGGVRVTAFSEPDLAPDFLKAAESTAEAAAWYRQVYGFFPVPHIGVIQGHRRWGGGFPLPNMFMIHQASLDPAFLTWITAHELGHYYWGLYVLDDGDRLGWIILANGIWADQLYMAQKRNVTLEEQWRSRRFGDWMVDYLQAMVENREQRLGVEREAEDSLGFDYNSLIRHSKGATGVYLQALRIGEQKFLEFQRQLLEDFRYKPLPEKEFISRLEEAGASGAEDFFSVWKRGDSRIGLDVRNIDDTSVVIARTGNVPYPVDVEIETPEGELIRQTMGMESDEVKVGVPGSRPLTIRIDPDGVVPMWNSAHPGIRGLYVEALFRAELTELFLIVARHHLTENPSDHRTRYLLARRFFRLADYGEVVSLGELETMPSSRYSCLAAIYATRAMGRKGKVVEARRHLNGLQALAVEFDLKSSWERANEEMQ